MINIEKILVDFSFALQTPSVILLEFSGKPQPLPYTQLNHQNDSILRRNISLLNDPYSHIAQFKKRGKRPWRSVTFRPKLTLLHGCFSCFTQLFHAYFRYFKWFLDLTKPYINLFEKPPRMTKNCFNFQLNKVFVALLKSKTIIKRNHKNPLQFLEPRLENVFLHLNFNKFL